MIYQIKRNDIVIFQSNIKGSRTQSVPTIDFVDIEFNYSEAILLERNDTIEFDGNTFYCDKQYFSVQKTSTNLYSHRARFLSENYKATDIALLDPNGEHIFNIEGNLLTLVTLAVDNLNRLESGWTYSEPSNTVTKLFQISNENVMSFLARVSGEFEIPFEITNKNIFFGDIAHVDGDDFAYGKGNGFKELTKSYTNEKVPNTIYVSGGNDFKLDEPVLNEGDIRINGIIEGFYTNDRIFPTTQNVVKNSYNANNRFLIDYLGYSIFAQSISGQRPLINFETGDLAGLSFYFSDELASPIDGDFLVIEYRTVDGIQYPNNNSKARAGDRFNVTNITMPQYAIYLAKEKLENDALNYLDELIKKRLNLTAVVDPLSNKIPYLNNKILINDINLDINDYFYVTEVKTYLQELQRREIKISNSGTWNLKLGLPIVNDNIIELSIDTNFESIENVRSEIIKKVDIDKANLVDRNFTLTDGKASVSLYDGELLLSSGNLKIKGTKLQVLNNDTSNLFLPSVGSTKTVLASSINIGGASFKSLDNGEMLVDNIYNKSEIGDTYATVPNWGLTLTNNTNF